MHYVEDPNMPIPLRMALIASDNEYHEELKEYLSGQDREKFKVSATALSKPTQSMVLYSRHKKEIWIDPEKDCWHSMRGGIIHFILEKYAATLSDCLTEQRVGVDIEVDGKMVHVHGKLDLYYRSTEVIQDWKNTSATSMLYDKEDHRWQLNVLYYLMRKNGYPVSKLEDVYLFDRLDPKMSNKPGYPTQLYQRVEVEKYPMSEIKAYIVERVRKIQEEYKKSDKNLTPCTDKERWIRETLYKIHVRKKTAKKGETPDFSTYAAFTSDSQDEALDYLTTNNLKEGNFLWKEIKGAPNGCRFCSAKTVCRQKLREIAAEDAKKEAKQSVN